MMYYKSDTEIGIRDSLPSNAVEITKEEYKSILADLQKRAEEEAEKNKPKNGYDIPDELYNTIIDDYTNQLIEEGAI